MPGRVKGVNILALVKVLRRAGRERAEAVLAPELHHYLDQRILVSSQYPEADHLGLLRAMAKLLPPRPDPWFTMGQLSARSDLNGLYRALLRPGDPKRTLQSANALWRNYHDTGDLDAVLETDNEVKLVLRGFVAPARELCRINIGYFTELVALAGGRDPICRELDCVVQGARQCAWSVRWS